MNNRQLDTTKKSNIKCEHCKHYNSAVSCCKLTIEYKAYYQRCKRFEWADRYEVKE